MILKCHLFDGQKTTIQHLEINETATISDLFILIGKGNTILHESKYYPVYDPNYWGSIQYVSVDNKVRWDQSYTGVKLTDFFNTHDITDNSIHVYVYTPTAGGPGWFDPVEMWFLFVSVIQGIRYAKSGFGWIKLKFKGIIPSKKLLRKSPGAFFSFIIKKPYWCMYELKNITGLSKGDSKAILKLLRYKWDPHNQVYRKTKDTNKAVKRLKTLNEGKGWRNVSILLRHLYREINVVPLNYGNKYHSIDLNMVKPEPKRDTVWCSTEPFTSGSAKEHDYWD